MCTKSCQNEVLNGYWPALATLAQHLASIGSVKACSRHQHAPLTRYIEPVLVKCWSTVYDAGPTLNQQLIVLPWECTARPVAHQKRGVEPVLV